MAADEGSTAIPSTPPALPTKQKSPGLSVLVVDHRELYAVSLVVALEPVAPRGRSATTWVSACSGGRGSVPDLLAINPFFEEGGHDASDVITHLHAVRLALPVLCWTTKPSPAAREIAELLGTDGYIHLELDTALLREAASVVAGGGKWFAEVPGRHPDFTDEELLVLNLLKGGRDLAGLQSGLHGLLGTAETWLEKLYTKLRARTHKGLIRKAVAAGLYQIPPSPGVVVAPDRRVD